MKSSIILTALVCSCLGFAAESPSTTEPASTPTNGTVPAQPFRPAAPVLQDRSLAGLTAEERKQYREAGQAVANSPEVKAAEETLRKAQNEVAKATSRLREARVTALKSVSPEMPAIVAKVETSRRAWLESQNIRMRGADGSMVPVKIGPSGNLEPVVGTPPVAK